MIALIVLGVVALVAVVATVRTVANDGYRPVRTDRTRIPDSARETRNVTSAAATPHPAPLEPRPSRSGDAGCGLASPQAASGVS